MMAATTTTSHTLSDRDIGWLRYLYRKAITSTLTRCRSQSVVVGVDF